MLRLFHLSKDHPEMARDEVIALAGDNVSHQFDDILVIETQAESLHSRLAYCRAVYRFLFICDEPSLAKTIDSVDWPSFYKGSFAVRFHDGKSKEKAVAVAIASKLSSPKVDLKSPNTRIELFKRGDRILCGILEGENDQDFESRKTHNRKAPHPSSMHPKLCRWFVNRTGIKKGVLIDPFCGSGGILIEAALMGFDVGGYDIDPPMIDRSRDNLEGSNVEIHLEVKDALSMKDKMAFIATDLPYGRATKANDIIPLYGGFLDLLEKNLTGCAVIGYPDFVDFEELVEKRRLNVVGLYQFYLHKSLTKMIIVLVPR